MHVDAPRLAMMDLTAHHCRIGVRFHLKPGDAVPVDVAALKVTLETDQKRDFDNHAAVMAGKHYLLGFVV